MNKHTKNLLASVAERAVKTFAQAFIAAYPVGTALGQDAFVMGTKIGASAAFYSLLMSLASLKFGKNGPSLAAEQIMPDEVSGHASS